VPALSPRAARRPSAASVATSADTSPIVGGSFGHREVHQDLPSGYFSLM
jgi:hypothetical protein